MILTNSIELTEKQLDNLHLIVREKFENDFTEDFWHFSFEGTRLNFDSMNQQCVFEVHSEKGSFNVFIDVNTKNKGLKSTIKINEL